MAAKILTVAAAVAIAIASVPPIRVQAQAACLEAFDSWERATLDLQADLNRGVGQVVVTDAASAALGGIKRGAAAIAETGSGTRALDVTSGVATDLANANDNVQTVRQFAGQLRSTKDLLDEFAECNRQRGIVPPCLLEIAGRAGQELRQWLQTLASEGTAAVAERVQAASNLLQGTVTRLGITAEGAMNAFMDNCAAQFPQQAQLALDSVQAGSPSAPSQPAQPARPPQPTGGGGIGAGSWVLIAGVPAIVGGVVLYCSQDPKPAGCGGESGSGSSGSSSSGSTPSTGSGSSSNTATIVSGGPIRCTRGSSGGGTFFTCAGDLTVRIGSGFTPGTRYLGILFPGGQLRTRPFTAGSVGSSEPLSVTGSGVVGCPPTQTVVGFWREFEIVGDSLVSSQTTSIQVTCN